MPQFFIKSSDFAGGSIIIKGDDFNHLKKARRIKPGDIIVVRSGDGSMFDAVVAEIHEDKIKAKVKKKIENIKTFPDITLYAGLLKGKMFDFVLQKAAEIGVSRIVPVITRRTVPVIGEKKVRWGKIVENAAKQCLRKDIPNLGDITKFEDAVSGVGSGIKIIAHPGNGNTGIRELFSSIKKNDKFSILVGPEGGFSNEELEMAAANKWELISFGFTALRAETASIVIPAILIHEWSMLK